MKKEVLVMVYSLSPLSLNFRDSVLSNTFWSSTDAYNATVRANAHDLHPPQITE
jgi:hypothetical protein